MCSSGLALPLSSLPLLIVAPRCYDKGEACYSAIQQQLSSVTLALDPQRPDGAQPRALSLLPVPRLCPNVKIHSKLTVRLWYPPVALTGIAGNDVCFSKVIAACGNGGRVELAMDVFHESKNASASRQASTTIRGINGGSWFSSVLY